MSVARPPGPDAGGGDRPWAPSDEATVPASPSMSAVPSATATARVPASTPDAPASLDWLKSLTPAPPPARVGDDVWAAVPTAAGVRVGIYRVLAIAGTTASLQDVVRVRWDNVPGALIAPVGDRTRLYTGSVVTYADWRGFVGIARVVRVVPTVRVTFRDAYEVVREETANVAEPMTGAIQRLEWVEFPKSGDASALHKGLVFAVNGDTLFVRGEDNQGWVVDRSRVKPLIVAPANLKVGDAVDAYSQLFGYRPGTVDKVFLPGLSYSVNVGGEPAPYFFSDLAERQPP